MAVACVDNPLRFSAGLLQQLRRLNAAWLPPGRHLGALRLGVSVAEEATFMARNLLDSSVGLSGRLLYGSESDQERFSTYRGQRRLVVLVPGYMQSPAGFQHLENQLGAEPFDAFTYVWGDFPYSQDLTLTAEQLARRLERVWSRCPAGEIYLVGHSQGGIVIRAMLQHGLARELPVRKCLFLSSPHQGTWTALAAIPHRGVRRVISLVPYIRRVCGESGLQLLPESSFLRELNSRPLPDGIQFSSVFYSLDPMIWPPTNAILPYPEARNFFIRKFGHIQPLYCPQAARVAVRELYGQVPAEGGMTEEGGGRV